MNCRITAAHSVFPSTRYKQKAASRLQGNLVVLLWRETTGNSVNIFRLTQGGYVITKNCRRFALNILAIGLCAFAGPVMAFDLGGALKQVQQAVKQPEPAPAQQQPAPPQPLPAPAQQPQIPPQGEAGAAQNTSGDQATSGTKRYRQKGQSMGDFMQESKQREQTEAEALAAKKEKAMTPDLVETSAPLEIKGVRIGMPLKEFLAVFPQVKVANTVQNTVDWVRGDAYVLIPDNSTSNCDKNCKGLTLIGKQSFASVMYFLDGKLAYVEIMFPRNGVKDPYTILFYDEILPALEEKFKAKSKSRETNITEKFGRKVSMRVAGWKNTLTKDSLELQDNDHFTFSNGQSDEHLLIRMQSETYTNTVNGRIDVVNGIMAKKEAAKEQRRKQDL